MKAKKPTSVRLTPDAKLRLKHVAKAENVTQQTIIQRAIEKYVSTTKGNK